MSLFERESALGGMLTAAAAPPGKDKLNWITEYYTHELTRLGVDIHLEHALDANSIDILSPNVLIIATGSQPSTPDIPGADRSNVLMAQVLLTRRMRFSGQQCAVIGGGKLGLETAAYLAHQGNRVTVLKRYVTLGRNIEPLYGDWLLRELREHGVRIVTCTQPVAIQAEGVLTQHASGGREMVRADWVVWAREAIPSNELARAVQDRHPMVVGDAVKPRRIATAIAEGHLAGEAC